MKSTVSAGRSKNANDSNVPIAKPQTQEFCFEIQFLSPPSRQLRKCPMKNSIPNPRVRNLISGRDSYISAVSQCASIPTNVLREGIRIDVSSTLKTSHVMNTKYRVTSHPISVENRGAFSNAALMNPSLESVKILLVLLNSC